MMSKLNAVRNNRLVWLTITNLNLYDIEGDHASEFLRCFYEQLRQNEWLRIVLDGMRGDVPSLPDNVYRAHIVPTLGFGEVQTYLNRFSANMRINLGDPLALGALDFALVTQYQLSVLNDPVRAMRDLLQMLLNFCSRFL